MPRIEFNSYGSRRGNHEVMMRGTFANVRLRNQLAPGTEGGWTTHQPSGELMTIFEAAMRYKEEGVPLVILGGSEYGTGSSRDWAAKGPLLLGVTGVARDAPLDGRSHSLLLGVKYANGQPLSSKEGGPYAAHCGSLADCAPSIASCPFQPGSGDLEVSTTSIRRPAAADATDAARIPTFAASSTNGG